VKKTTPDTLTADWSVLSPRAPWEHVTSMELSRLLGVHLQTINNWRIRRILPEPAPNSRQLRGNKNYWRCGVIRALLEGKKEDDLVREWVKQDIGADNLTDGQIVWLLSTLHKVSWEFS
jgi:hypothetical protein